MTKLPPIESIGVRIANSAGFWIFLFAAFGLLTLSLGENRIQKRMHRQMVKTGMIGGESTVNEMPASESRPADGKTVGTGVLTNKNHTRPYRLTGLRWILGFAVLVGLGGLVFTLASPAAAG